MLRMRRRTLALACACCAAVTGWAQYQDYSQIGRTPEALRFLDDPLKIELKEPAWLFGGPKMGTPAEQLLLAERLEREGKREEAVEAYDDLVHEWHASPEALTAQLAIARLESAAGRAQQAYDADVYLLAHFAGRFELEPVLADAVAQADALKEAAKNPGMAGATMGAGLGFGMGNMFGSMMREQPAAAAAETTACPKCGARVPASAKFCPDCGQPMGNVCPKCGKPVKAGAKFCPECGAPLHAVCPKCGKPVKAGAKFCPECGAKL